MAKTEKKTAESEVAEEKEKEMEVDEEEKEGQVFYDNQIKDLKAEADDLEKGIPIIS